MKNKVLVVDDNYINRKLLYRILNDRFTVLEAENGYDALNVIENNQDVGAILLDLMMPVMDGFGFLEQFSQTEKFSYTPVFVVSASAEGDFQEKALDLGVVDFISKPYNPILIYKKISNVMDLIQAQKELRIIGKDSLTGLCTMPAFRYYTNEILRKSDEKFYLIQLDINDFRLVNSDLGHEQGNNILNYIGRVIADYDPENIIAGRAFGDRFLLFGSHEVFGDNPEFMKSKCEELLLNMLGDLNISISIRIGVVEIYDCDMDISSYIDQVSIACNAAGRGEQVSINYYDEKIVLDDIYHKAIVDDFRKSMENDCFEMYLQPKFNLKSNEIFGAEALVRWNHPEYGFISPGDFIPVLEKNNMIDQLDYHMMEKACRYIGNRVVNNLDIIPVSVNISRYDLNDEIIDKFNHLFEKYNIDKKMVHLEITESYANLGTERLIEVTENLKDNGFVLELDDFGSGYSSLNVLSEMKIDTIKLDVRFTRNLMKNTNIVKYVVNLAELMNHDLIIEGVETEAEKIC